MITKREKNNVHGRDGLGRVISFEVLSMSALACKDYLLRPKRKATAESSVR